MPDQSPQPAVLERALVARLLVLHGDDSQAIEDLSAQLVLAIEPPEMAGFAVARLDGKTASRREVETAINTLPFGTPRRLVLASGLIERCAKGDEAAWLAGLLDGMPSTTLLALIIPDERRWQRGAWQWNELPKHAWLNDLVQRLGTEAALLTFQLPVGEQMAAWISAEAVRQGGSFEPRAAAELAGMLGNDTRQARHEIAKTLAFAAYARPVSAQDVRQVCNVSVQEKVFALTDACAEGQRARALSLLREQLRENSEGALLGMLARQFRNLIIARESLSQRGTEQDISAACGVPLFAARKLVQQARRFKLERLVSLYQRLDELDGAIKSGQSAADTGLELFIAQLSA